MDPSITRIRDKLIAPSLYDARVDRTSALASSPLIISAFYQVEPLLNQIDALKDRISLIQDQT